MRAELPPAGLAVVLEALQGEMCSRRCWEEEVVWVGSFSFTAGPCEQNLLERRHVAAMEYGYRKTR